MLFSSAYNLLQIEFLYKKKNHSSAALASAHSSIGGFFFLLGYFVYVEFIPVLVLLVSRCRLCGQSTIVLKLWARLVGQIRSLVGTFTAICR